MSADELDEKLRSHTDFSMKKFCTIPDCNKIVDARGLCAMHYRRFRLYGAPLGGPPTRAGKGVLIAWMNQHKSHEDRENCLTWPFAKNKNGYGAIVQNGRATTAHRVMCEKAHGPAPTQRHQAAHSCGKGDTGCVNPHHLRWATPKENQADRVVHGTTLSGERCPTAKLSAAVAARIFASVGTCREVAKQYGVSAATVSLIRSGKAWRTSQSEAA